MSSMLEGIKAYKDREAAAAARKAEAARPNINRLILDKDGDSVTFRFLQEIDFDSPGYNPELGLGFVNIEHQHPDPQQGWRNRANCTIESQGQCYPCSRVQDHSVEWDNRKGWKQKEKFYINVVAGPAAEVSVKNNKTALRATDIDRATGDGEVYLIDQGTFNGIYDALVSYVLDPDSGGTIVDRFFKITRTGSEWNNTKYTLMPLKELPKSAPSPDSFELVDIKQSVLREIPYDSQEVFYLNGIETVASSVEQPSSTTTASVTTDEW